MILLLQSSDRVSHDICESLPQLGGSQGAAPLILALRKWHKLSPDREFRCFVKDNNLAGKPVHRMPKLVLARLSAQETFRKVISVLVSCLQSKRPTIPDEICVRPYSWRHVN